MKSTGAVSRRMTLLSWNRDVLLFLVLFANTARLVAYLGTPAGSLDATDATGNIGDQLFWLFALADAILIAALFRVPPKLVILALIPALLILIWATASSIWSEYPYLTVRRSFRLIVEMTTIMLIALSVSNASDALKVLFRAFIATLVLDVIVLIVVPSSLTTFGFVGVHGHKNVAGQFYLVALPVFILGIFNRAVTVWRPGALLAATVGLTLLLLTLSKTSIGVFVASLIIITIGRMGTAALDVRYRFAALIICALILVLAGLVIADYGFYDITAALFGDPSLTGRDGVWRFLLYKWSQHNPLLGVGYGALWQAGPAIKTDLISNRVLWMMNEGHNGYLDLLAQLGVTGCLLLAIFLFVSTKRIYRYLMISGKTEVGIGDYAAYLFIASVGYNMAESSFFRPGDNLWIVLVFVVSVLSKLSFRKLSPRARSGAVLNKGDVRVSLAQN